MLKIIKNVLPKTETNANKKISLMPSCPFSHDFQFILFLRDTLSCSKQWNLEAIFKKPCTEIGCCPRITRLWIRTRNWGVQQLQAAVNKDRPRSRDTECGQLSTVYTLAKDYFSTDISTHHSYYELGAQIISKIVLKVNSWQICSKIIELFQAAHLWQQVSICSRMLFPPFPTSTLCHRKLHFPCPLPSGF